MNLSNLVVVDVETSGISPTRDRIIEIGMVVVQNGQIIEEWEHLINPDTYLSPYITAITGIEATELETAPTFSDLAEQVIERLEDRVFVAHNARFDYSFLKQELKRVGYELKTPQLCTARLSRQLFPFHRHHNLDALIERHQLSCIKRHRALGDAQATFEFLAKVTTQLPRDIMTKQLTTNVKRPSLPPNLKQEQIDALPECPGVYMFYGTEPQPLYVGKSIHIRERVREHFYNDTNTKELKLWDQVCHIEAIPTAGEVEALLLESSLIKKHLPLYNQRLRQYTSLVTWRLEPTEAGYLSLRTVRNEVLLSKNLDSIAGIFKSAQRAKKSLLQLAQDNDLCFKYLGLEKTKGACFHYHLKKCKGACLGKETPAQFNHRLLQAVQSTKVGTWPFEGPILYSETNLELELTRHHIFDHWCYVRSVSELENIEGFLVTGEDGLTTSLQFDVDVFAILRRFIFGKKATIRVLPRFRNNPDSGSAQDQTYYYQ